MAQRRGAPQYVLLARNLIEKIRQGTYPVGSLLPTEAALGEQFNVSRITVRAALRELETQGLITRRARIGTRVNAVSPTAAFVHAGDSIDDILVFTKGMPFHRTQHRIVTIDEALAADMRLPIGQEFADISGVRGHDGQLPIAFSHHYIPALLEPPAEAFDDLTIAVADLVAECSGKSITTIKQEIEPARLTAAQARQLDARAGSTALKSRRWFFDQNQDLLVATWSIFPEGRYVFSSVMRREPATR